MLKVTLFDDCSLRFEGDAIVFRQKPNAILYCIEAMRGFLLLLLVMSVALILLLHIAGRAPIAFLVELAFFIDCFFFAILIVVLMFVALNMEFILTNKHVIVRFSPFGVGDRRLSIPIEDVASVEVRGYGPRYGSAYLERYGTDDKASRLRPVNLKRVQGNTSIWLSLPLSWPAGAGFYGFRNYNTFASLIVSLRSGAQPN